MGQQHDQHRHRLRVRRPADRAALARARARLGRRRSRTYYEPAKPFLPPDEAAPAVDEERPPFLLDVDDVAGKRIIETRLRAHRHGPRGERGSRARGDEPVRDRPALAGLPAADDGADRDLAPAGRPRASRAGVRRLPRRRRPAGHLRGEAHGLAGDRHRLPRRRRREGAVRRRQRRDRRDLHAAPGGRSFEPADSAEALCAASAPPSTRPASGTSSTTDWLLLDCELLPWSAKAIELIRRQYAAVGAAAHAGLAASDQRRSSRPQSRGLDVADLLDAERRRGRSSSTATSTPTAATCWPVSGVDDLRLAPFHVLAAETGVLRRARPRLAPRALRPPRRRRPGLVHDDRPARRRPHRPRQPGSRDRMVGAADRRAAARGWSSSPRPSSREDARASSSPASSAAAASTCGSSTAPSTPTRASSTGCAVADLGRKRSLAMREFALGVEALERFVRREPLYRVHECVFGVLAMESEPVDPRL